MTGVLTKTDGCNKLLKINDKRDGWRIGVSIGGAITEPKLALSPLFPFGTLELLSSVVLSPSFPLALCASVSVSRAACEGRSRRLGVTVATFLSSILASPLSGVVTQASHEQALEWDVVL